jgi:D-threo-aldose 1-dehydrogenase
VPPDRAVATVRRAFAGPINFLDTSNNYGAGDSERRIGEAIAAAGGLPDGFVLATKVDPLHGSTDFSGDRVRASVEESLSRFGLARLDLVHLHDPERISFADAGGPPDLLRRYLETEVFEVVLNHNRFSLLDRMAEELMDDAARRGVAFVNAAPYGGGLLVKGAAAQPNYAYRPASAEVPCAGGGDR